MSIQQPASLFENVYEVAERFGQVGGYKKGILPLAQEHAARLKREAEARGAKDHAALAARAEASLKEVQASLPVALYWMANVQAALGNNSADANVAYTSMRALVGHGRAELEGAPHWQGEAAPDKTLLLYTTDGQGLGDVFQHLGQVGHLARAGLAKKVIMEVPKRLMPLLRGYRAPGVKAVMGVVARGDKLPAYDLACPIMDLPQRLGLNLQTYRAANYNQPNAGYLTPPAVLSAEHQRWINEEVIAPMKRGEVVVGLSWQGDRNNAALEPARSLPHVQTLAPLFGVKGLRFVNLQFGPEAAQLNDLPDAHRARIAQMPKTFDALAAFSDTMHVMRHIQTVSTDTGTIHAAGAVGGSTVALLPHIAEQRWPSTILDARYKLTPAGALSMQHNYYRDMTLFAQPCEGQWAPVAQAAANHLEGVVASHKGQMARRGVSAPRPGG